MGTAVLALVTRSRRALFRERLSGWPEEDLTRFASYLVRYNAAATAYGTEQPEAGPPGD